MAALYALPRCTLCVASLHFMRCLAALYALPHCTLCAEIANVIFSFKFVMFAGSAGRPVVMSTRKG